MSTNEAMVINLANAEAAGRGVYSGLLCANCKERRVNVFFSEHNLLESLVNEQVRVAARSFFPHRVSLESHARFFAVRDLYLPDNQQPSGMPVFFEGRLRQFERAN